MFELLAALVVACLCPAAVSACEIRLKMSSRDPASDQLVNHKKKQVS